MIDLARWAAFVKRVRGMLAPPADQGDLVEVEGEVPLAMGMMLRDLLGQRGIPALLRDSGIGRGALGGAPNLVRLMVPSAYADKARWWLAPEHGLTEPAAPGAEALDADHAFAGDQGGGDRNSADTGGGGDDTRSEDDGER